MSASDRHFQSKIQLIRESCLSHASDLLRAAKRVIEEEKLPNIAYHLAALALEEIGKVGIVGMGQLTYERGQAFPWEKHAQDHIKKLFWALWGPSFGREVITKEQIESFLGLAQRIHDTRLSGLYVGIDEDNKVLPRDAVTETDAKNLISLANSRLEMEKCSELSIPTEDLQNNLSWFLAATDDPEKRSLIFGQKSMEKLAELGHPREWITWLKEQFDQAEAEGRTLAEQELRRSQPIGDEATQNKWKLKIRFYTNSHSIRTKPLNWWNGISNWIKLYPVSNKREEILVEFTLPKRIPIQGMWWAGWGIARKFVTAMNIGSMGYFWWYVPEQISRYYEELRDIENDSKVVIERSPILRLDWKRDALLENDLRSIAHCFAMLPGPDDKDRHEPFNYYITGLAFLSKNDIHVQFEPNAYEQFYKSLKSGMRLYKDWDETVPFTTAFDTTMADFVPNAEERKKYLNLGEQFETDSPDPKGVTLSETGFMKVLCDAYFLMTFKKMLTARKEI